MALVTLTPYVANTVLTAAALNNNFNAIVNQVNGNLDSTNIAAGAITSTQLATGAVDLSTVKVTGNIPVGRFNSGTNAGNTTFWRGDGGWFAPPTTQIAGQFKNLKVVGAGVNTAVITADTLVFDAGGGTTIADTSISVTPDISAGGANGLDAGSSAANTGYYGWVIRKSSDGTKAGLWSLSSTAPTMPTGYDQKALVTYGLTDGSKHILAFHQYARKYFYTSWPTIASGNVGASAWVSIDTTKYVPSALAHSCYGWVGGTATQSVTNDNTIANSNVAAIRNQAFSTGGHGMRWEFDVITANTLYWSSDNSSAAVYLHGFQIDTLT